MTATENYMLPYWDQVQEDAERKVRYASRQKEPLILRLLGQMALPIEAGMDEDSSED